MNAQSLCWQHNQIIATQQARINVLDHGFLYGDGVFEGIRFYNKKPFMLDAHLQRLEQSAQAIALKMPATKQQIDSYINDLIGEFAQPDGYIRLIISRGIGNLGINPAQCKTPQMTIIADQINVVNQNKQQGVSVCIAKTQRIPVQCIDPKIKSLNYLNNILARIEANEKGFDEAVMLNQHDYIAEGSVDNVFIIQQGELITPPESAGILMGITRQVIIKLASENGISVKEKNFGVKELMQADECFLTGTGAELLPVNHIESKALDVTQFKLFPVIQSLFKKEIDRQCGG